ncbi:MAG: hypothetical protein HY059_11675 [Proteobacteria bacterium]|nr:hypothetical protein [Pseudomonadota bacterium]
MLNSIESQADKIARTTARRDDRTLADIAKRRAPTLMGVAVNVGIVRAALIDDHGQTPDKFEQAIVTALAAIERDLLALSARPT